MKQRITLSFMLLALGTAGSIVAFSLSAGQSPRPGGDPNPIKPAAYSEPAAPRRPIPESESLRGVYISARSGSEWLLRGENPLNGRFNPGWIPALNCSVESDNFLHQAMATVCLARAADYYGDERYLMKARQAVLSLLAETQLDAGDPTSRHTSLPAMVVNRVAAAGLLLMAIHELQNPAAELIKQGEELARYIQRQQQGDGSFHVVDNATRPAVDRENDISNAGWALQGIMRSQRRQPAAWKLEVVAKALPYCRQQWKSSPGLAQAAQLTPAFAEAFVQTRIPDYSQFVFEMSDWTCSLQYGADTGNAKWVGGFKEFTQGKPVLRAPSIAAAANLEALAWACLATRHVPDAARYHRYREALGLGIPFLSALQYSESNTLHFAPGYRPALIGGFHQSSQNGNLSLDSQHYAVAALLARLTCVGDK